MATYRLKRKTYGLVDAAENTVGGAAGGIGNAMDTKVGGAIGGAAGAMTAGKWIGNGLQSLNVPGAGFLGTIGGALLGYHATRGLGKGLKQAGDNLQGY